MSTEPRFEIGADYDGSDYRHHQLNEVRVFENDKVSRIFMPECGVFYTESMIIRNINTGEELKRGEHYELQILDAMATNHSGKEVCGIVVITDNDIAGVILEYRYVGGLHSTGYYILEELIKMYPSGAGGVISYYDLINIPDEFDPAYHTQHVHQFYSTDEMLVYIERLRQQVILKYSANLNKLYDNAQETIDKLYFDLEDKGDKLLDDIKETLEKISIQSDEYILTDSAEDPFIKRKYGQWELVTDRILHGVSGTISVIGHGGTIGIGSERIIRNCYIWKNIQNTISPLTPSFTVVNSGSPINSGDTIKFEVTCVNVPDGTSVKWAVTDNNGDDTLPTKYTVPITATVKDGKFTASLTTTKSSFYSNPRNHVFYLVDAADVTNDFIIADQTTTKETDKLSFVNIMNNNISTVTEDEKFKLKISAVSGFGRKVYIKWVYGTGLSAKDFKDPLPTEATLTSEATYIALETVGNLTVSGNRTLTAHLLSYSGEQVTASTPTALIEILDTSTEFNGNIKFYTPAGLLVTNVDEGSDFNIRFTANGGVGREVTFAYRSNRMMDEFDGLVSKGVVDLNKRIEYLATINADFLTNEEVGFLEVTALYQGKAVAVNTININDTYKTPAFNVNFAKQASGGDRISMVNDGETFYAVIQVPGWVNGKIPPSLDFKLVYTGSTSLDSRVTYPAGYEHLEFGSGNNVKGVQWLNNNTLAIELSTKDAKTIFGNGTLRLDWKMSQSNNYTEGPTINLINTSVPTISAAPSSSMTTLTPITQINEMTTMGENSVFYIWLEFDGNVASFDNLKLDFAPESEASASDITMVLPTNINVTSGTNKQVLTCGVNADFLTEGNEKLILRGTADNYEGDVFKLELLIVDNSIQSTLTMQFSTSATSVIAPPTNMSEWDALFVHFTYASYQFATTLALTDTNASAYSNFPATLTVPANTTKQVLELNTRDSRRSTGVILSHVFTAVRKHNNKVMTNTATGTVKYMNDKIPPYYDYLYVSTSATAGVDEVDRFGEGGDFYIHVGLACAFKDTIVGVKILTDDSNGLGAVVAERVSGYTPDVVIGKTTVSAKETVHMVVPFHVIANHKDDSNNFIKITAAANWNMTTKQVGDSVVLDYSNESSVQVNKTTFGAFLDLSKSPVLAAIEYYNHVGGTATHIDEGKSVRYSVTLRRVTEGDKWVCINDDSHGVGMDRFLTHEFDTVVRTVGAGVGTEDKWNAEWTHTVLANEKTDTNNTAGFKVKNLVTGQILPISKTYTINDISKTTTVTTSWVDANDKVVTSVDEGVTVRLKVVVTNPNTNTKVIYTRTGGRDSTLMKSPTEFDTSKTIPSNGIVYFSFTPADNFKIDEINTLVGVVTLDVKKDLSIPVSIVVNDTSRGGNITEYLSTDKAGSDKYIAALLEGTTYYMQISSDDLPAGTVITLGIDQEYDNVELTESSVTLDANGKATITVRAKSVSEITSPVDVVIKFRVIFKSALFSADVYSSNYYTTHSNSNGNVFKSIVWKHMVNGSMVNITKASPAAEGDIIYAYVQLNTTHVNMPVNAALDLTANHVQTANGIKRFELLDTTVNVDINYLAVFRVQTYKDYYTNSTSGYLEIPVMFSAHSNSYRSVGTITDTSKLPVISSMYWSTNPEGTDTINNVVYEQVFYLIVKTAEIGGDPAVVMNLSYPNSTFLQKYLNVGNIEGTKVLGVGTYDSATGVGHTYVKLQLKPDPQPIISTPADGYYRASDADKLSQIYIGPGETLFIQMAAGDGGDSDSFGDYGGWTIGPQATSHVIFKPGTTPKHSGGYVSRTPEKLINYGSQPVVNTNEITSDLMVAVTPANATGYYSDDWGSSASDMYLDNAYGGEFGEHYIRFYTGIEFNNLVTGYYDSVNDVILTISPGDEQGERYSGYGAFYQFNITNVTANPITLPVLLNDAEGIVTARYDAVANIGYIRVFNETKATALGKSFVYGKSYVLFNTRSGNEITALCIDHETAGSTIAYTIIKQSLSGNYSTLAPIRIVNPGTFPSRERVYRAWTTAEKNDLINNPNIGYLVSASDTERVYRIDGDSIGFEILPQYTASGTNYLTYDVYFYDVNGTQIGHVKRVGVMHYNRLGGTAI